MSYLDYQNAHTKFSPTGDAPKLHEFCRSFYGTFTLKQVCCTNMARILAQFYKSQTESGLSGHHDAHARMLFPRLNLVVQQKPLFRGAPHF